MRMQASKMSKKGGKKCLLTAGALGKDPKAHTLGHFSSSGAILSIGMHVCRQAGK